MKKLGQSGLHLRIVILAVSDSLVSTVGILAGVDVSGAPYETVVLTGLVYAFVESFSMGVGTYISEESAEEYAAKTTVAPKRPFMAAVIMFFAWGGSAFIPLAPYLLLPDAALPVSIVVSILALFVAGVIGARVSRLPVLWRGGRMALLGGVAILIGCLVGITFKLIFHI